MPDYSKGKIYKIQCDTTGLVYIGSTTQNLARRISDHVKKSQNGYGCSSRYILENNNYRYSLVECFPCESKEQLHMREQYHIDQNECVNKYNAFRTEELKKEQLRSYSKKWVENNPEKRKESCKKWNDTNVEKRKEYNQMRSKTQEFKEYHAKYQREWFAKKKAQLLSDSISSGSTT